MYFMLILYDLSVNIVLMIYLNKFTYFEKKVKKHLTKGEVFGNIDEHC